jgi:hypothetical protein
VRRARHSIPRKVERECDGSGIGIHIRSRCAATRALGFSRRKARLKCSRLMYIAPDGDGLGLPGELTSIAPASLRPACGPLRASCSAVAVGNANRFRSSSLGILWPPNSHRVLIEVKEWIYKCVRTVETPLCRNRGLKLETQGCGSTLIHKRERESFFLLIYMGFFGVYD